MTYVKKALIKRWEKLFKETALVYFLECTCTWHFLVCPGSRGPGRQLAQYQAPPIELTSARHCFNKVRSSCRVTPSQVHLQSHVLWAAVSRKWSEPKPPVLEVNPRVPLGHVSHFAPVALEWLYHDDSVGTQSAGFLREQETLLLHK